MDIEKIKQFLNEHKTEIAIAASAIIIYRIGFKRGYGAANGAITNLFEQLGEALSCIDVTNF